MADLKISQLTAISVLTPATDVLPVVDVGGVTKKITTNQILASGGVASLASATITGDLTVDTNVLKVDTTNNRVGIGTASPAAGYALDVRGLFGAGNGTIIGGISYSTRPEIGAISNHNLGLIANNTTMHLITTAGVFDWYDGAGGTRMTLNSTGLAVGTTPANDKILSLGSMGILLSGATSDFSFRNSGGTAIQRLRYTDATGTLTIGSATATSYPVELGGDTTARAVTIDTSGNLLVGTTSGTLFRIISSFLSSSGNGGIKLIDSQSNNTAVFANFSNGTGTLGSITNNNNAGVLYNVTSDKRLKENISDSESASLLIDSLQVRKFDWKANNSHQRYGFIAQELVTVVPEAVYQPTNSDDMMAVDYSKLVPMLVKEIQSLRTRVQTLEAR